MLVCPQVFDQKLSNFRNYLLLGSNGFLYICVCVSDCLLNFKRNHLQLFSSCKTFSTEARKVPEKMEFLTSLKITRCERSELLNIRQHILNFTSYYWTGTFLPLLLGYFYPFVVETFYPYLLEYFYPLLLGHFTPSYWDIYICKIKEE